MTDRANHPPMPRRANQTVGAARANQFGNRRRAGRPGFAPVLWGSLSLFAVLFAFLTYQLSAGRDPSLAAAGSSPRPIVLRKVVKRRVVTTVVPTPGTTSVSSGPATTSSTPAIPPYGAVVTGSS